MIDSSYVRMGGDLERVLQTGIGNNRRAAQTFFQFLMRGGREQQIREAWRWMDERGFASRPLARSWANRLLQQDHAEEAATVWMRHGATDTGAYRRSNWVDNAGFEEPLTGEGFDWLAEPCAGVKTAWDERIVHAGSHSLRLELDAADNLDFHHISQRVWLEPGRYRLSGWVRTSGLTTDQGVGFRLAGTGNAGDSNVLTPAAVGSQPWTRLSAEFSTHAPARLAKVEIVRRPSEKFDNRPHGTAWIDDVEIQRLP